MSYDYVDSGYLREIKDALKEQNRKLDDLVAAMLTLASIEQRKLRIAHPTEGDDVIESFSIIRDLLKDRK